VRSLNQSLKHFDQNFTKSIDDAHKMKPKQSFTYGTKVRVVFIVDSEKPIIYVNRIARLEIAVKKSCLERRIDSETHYFPLHNVELPNNVPALQFGFRNGSTVSGHVLDD
jgi:regulator of extracellular matrix RemA (YlzA/DUF370 family)